MSLWYTNQTTSERNSIEEGCLLILWSWYSLMMTLQKLHQATHVVISIRSMLISTYRTQRMNQDWCCSIVKSFFSILFELYLNIFITCFLIVYTHFQWWLKICVVRVIWWQIRNLLSTRLIVKMTLYTR